MKQCVKIKVSGKVQGVGYREFVKKHAQKLSIEGATQNSDDKKCVLIQACGLSENLDKLIDSLYKGTPKSKIEDIHVEPLINKKNFREVFRILGE